MEKMLILSTTLMLFCCLISVPVFSEKLSESILLNNQVFKKNNFENNWFIETVDSFGDVGQYTDIAIDSNNKVYISYYDFGKKDLKFATLLYNTWSINIVDSTGDVGKCASLALDSLDNPHISYYDETHHALKHAYFNGIWNTEFVDSIGDVGLDNSIAIDSSNHIHISYHDEINGDLKYAKSVDDGWDIQVVDSIGNTGEISSITLDKNGNPHISYTNRYDFRLYHAYYVDDNWVIEKVDDESVLYGSTSITFDPEGFEHILYYDVTPDHFSLKHAYKSSDGWHLEIIDPYLWGGFGTGGANIVFDNLGRSHIGYFDWAALAVDYAFKINGIWNLEFVDVSDVNITFVGSYTALAVDSHGIPHISYMDYMNLDLKYARKIEYSPGVPIPPSGSLKGKPGEAYTFTTTSIDFDNDKIQYGWDWNGDLEVDQWTDFINSGENCEISHSWDEPGSYKIRVICMDEKGNTNKYHVDEDGFLNYWSDSLSIKISKSKISGNILLPRIFTKLVEQFPLLQKIVTTIK